MNNFKDYKGFPVSFWNYTDSDMQRPEDVADWKKLGMNFAMSPEFDIEKNNKENFIKILDEAEKNSIKIVVCDSRFYWHNLSRGEEEYRKGFLSALKDFGSHPAVIGFHVGDEPDRYNLDMCCKAYCIQKELAPNLSPFFNLLAWNHDQKAIKDLTGYNDWEAYLENVWKKTHCDLLCYDCYFQMNPKGEYWDTYFANLNYHNTVAQRHNIPWWTTLLSVGHFRYECPDADALRWQINSAVAHGAKGIIWFYIYGRVIEINYRYAPINEFGEKTQTFDNLSYEVRKFRRQFEGVIENLTLEKVFHKGRTYGNTPLFREYGDVIDVTGEHNTPAIVSFYNDGYVGVVNNSRTDSDRFFIEFGDNVKKVVHIGDYGREVEVYPKKIAYFDHCDRKGKISFWLAPGGMEIFKVN